VLEVVHVDVAGGEADVGRDPVGELHQLDFQALFAGFFHGGFQGNGEGGGGADLQRCVGGEYRELNRPRARASALTGWRGGSWS
jgi:hypothetical protein